MTGSNTGRFTNWIGTAKPSETGELTSMSIVVQTTDVEANFEAPTKWSKKLEAHLRDDDFFASEKHPTATFQLGPGARKLSIRRPAQPTPSPDAS